VTGQGLPSTGMLLQALRKHQGGMGLFQQLARERGSSQPPQLPASGTEPCPSLRQQQATRGGHAAPAPSFVWEGDVAMLVDSDDEKQMAAGPPPLKPGAALRTARAAGDRQDPTGKQPGGGKDRTKQSIAHAAQQLQLQPSSGIAPSMAPPPPAPQLPLDPQQQLAPLTHPPWPHPDHQRKRSLKQLYQEVVAPPAGAAVKPVTGIQVSAAGGVADQEPQPVKHPAQLGALAIGTTTTSAGLASVLHPVVQGGASVQCTGTAADTSGSSDQHMFGTGQSTSSSGRAPLQPRHVPQSSSDVNAHSSFSQSQVRASMERLALGGLCKQSLSLPQPQVSPSGISTGCGAAGKENQQVQEPVRPSTTAPPPTRQQPELHARGDAAPGEHATSSLMSPAQPAQERAMPVLGAKTSQSKHGLVQDVCDEATLEPPAKRVRTQAPAGVSTESRKVRADTVETAGGDSKTSALQPRDDAAPVSQSG
jgi:hypothetical protein